MGDGIADDSDALQVIMDIGGRVYFPIGQYRISRTIKINSKDLAIYGEGTNNNLPTFTSTIVSSNGDMDYFYVQAYSSFNIRNITFAKTAGSNATPVSMTPTSITMDRNLNDVSITTAIAETLAVGKLVYTFRTYAYNGKLYRVQSVVGGIATVANFPTHASGIAVLDGITWVYKGAGTTYQIGQYANAAQWWFHGISGDTLLDVTLSEYSADPNLNPTNFEGGSFIGNQDPTGKRAGYFVDLNLLDGQPAKDFAYINLNYANDPFILGCWFLQAPNIGIKRVGDQGGLTANNEWDGGKIAIKGNFTETIYSNNRFYGMQKCFDITSTQDSPLINGNYFDLCGECIAMTDSAFNPSNAEPNVSTISSVQVTGNYINLCKTFLNFKGVRSCNIQNNIVNRGGSTQVILKNTLKCKISNNKFLGCGELTPNSNYFNFEGQNIGNEISGNFIEKINPGESCTYVFNWINNDLNKNYIFGNTIIGYDSQLSNVGTAVSYRNNALSA